MRHNWPCEQSWLQIVQAGKWGGHSGVSCTPEVDFPPPLQEGWGSGPYLGLCWRGAVTWQVQRDLGEGCSGPWGEQEEYKINYASKMCGVEKLLADRQALLSGPWGRRREGEEEDSLSFVQERSCRAEEKEILEKKERMLQVLFMDGLYHAVVACCGQLTLGWQQHYSCK